MLYHRNLTTELKNTPKVYFIDTGIRNIFISDFKRLNMRTDRSELFENYLFLNLFSALPFLAEIRYWKTRNKQEIDFIVNREGSLYAFEAKFSAGKSVSFKAFQNVYPQAVCKTVSFSNADRSKGELFGWQNLLP